jgi:hypothetical protein
VLARAGLGLASARVGSWFSWSAGTAWGNGTLRRFMVRRRSTVRFRKGAPAQAEVSNLEPSTSLLRVANEWQAGKIPGVCSTAFPLPGRGPGRSNGGWPSAADVGRCLARSPSRLVVPWSKADANPLIRSLTQVASHAHDRLVVESVPVLWRYTHGAVHALGPEPSSRIKSHLRSTQVRGRSRLGDSRGRVAPQSVSVNLFSCSEKLRDTKVRVC